MDSRDMYMGQNQETALRQPRGCARKSLHYRPRSWRSSANSRRPEAFYAEVYDCGIDGKACSESHVDLLKDDGVIKTVDALRWDFDRCEKQMVNVLNVLEVVRKDKQVLFDADTLPNTKTREDGLRTS